MNIYTLPEPAQGSHWDTLRPVDEYLRECIEDMASALHLSRGEATSDDYGRLGSDAVELGANDWIVHDWIEATYLSVEVARWMDPDGDNHDGTLARVELVTGTGGPHTEVCALFSRNGGCERVEAHQYWSGSREAWTTGYRALSVMADFCQLLGLDE